MFWCFIFVFLVAFSALAIDWDSDTRRLLLDEQEAQVVVCSVHKQSVCECAWYLKDDNK